MGFAPSGAYGGHFSIGEKLRLPFVKMHGLGNDYVFVDGMRRRISRPSQLARRISQRRLGVGSDGLILILPSKRADARMAIYNADGSEAAMCGNGIRCVAKYLYENGRVRRNPFHIETAAGIRDVFLFARNGRVKEISVDMGRPLWEGREIPVAASGLVLRKPLRVGGKSWKISCVSMGNPHAVLFVPRVQAVPLEKIGPLFERHPFFSHRVNVEFVQMLSRRRLRVRVWERGSGATLACGTGACAAMVVSARLGFTERDVSVELPGGRLSIRWDSNDHVWMNGPAEEVFRGEIAQDFLDRAIS